MGTMGTFYVLLMEGGNELLVWYTTTEEECSSTGSSSSLHERYSAVADAWFCFGAALGSIVPYIIWEQLSAEWVCYVAVLVVLAYYAVYTAAMGVGVGCSSSSPRAVGNGVVRAEPGEYDEKPKDSASRTNVYCSSQLKVNKG